MKQSILRNHGSKVDKQVVPQSDFKKLLSTIIVSYNTKELTLQTIHSLVADLFNSNLLDVSEIIIIDNNSSDDSVSAIQSQFKIFAKQYPQLTTQLLPNSKNTGFAQANNQGIEIAAGEYILLLNSDTVVQSGAIQKLLSSFTHVPTNETTAYLSSYHGTLDRLGMVAAHLQNPDGSYQPQGGDLPSLLTLSTHLLCIDDIPLIGRLLPSTQHTGLRGFNLRGPVTNIHPHSTIEQKGWIAATAVMIPRRVIAEIGSLDQNIFMYGEDMEWCIRAKNHLYDVGIQHQAIITHFGSASSHSSSAIIGELKGYEYIFAKHKPLWQRIPVKLLLGIASMLRVILFGTILATVSSSDKRKLFQKRANAYKSYLNSFF